MNEKRGDYEKDNEERDEVNKGENRRNLKKRSVALEKENIKKDDGNEKNSRT